MSEIAELSTIRDLLRWTVSSFNEAGIYYGHGTENAWDEALALILHTLHLPNDINPAVLDARLTKKERDTIYSLVHRRITERVPLPYLTHEAWFASLSFFVDERVLIPRSPIAELINSQFQPWIDIDSIHNILDLCTGSGCIAVACAKMFPDAKIVASDIAADALAVAKINVLRHEVQDQVELVQSDLFENIPVKKFDIIVSNPPYVDEEDMASLPAEFKHEPELGLASGTQGLDAAEKILREAHQFLQPHGILIVEVGNSEIALAEKYPDVSFTWLEFENGGGGVFLLTAEELGKYVGKFNR